MKQTGKPWERPENQTAKAVIPQNLAESWIRQAKNNPDHTALLCGDRRWSYAQICNKACAIASALVSLGLLEGDRAAVTLPRGGDMVCAVLGVLLAGGVYVPIGTHQPSDRRERICQKADIRFCITNRSADIAADPALTCVFAEETDASAEAFEPVLSAPENSAYIIFTSGSTGEPKGVEVTHQAAWNTIADVSERLGLTKTDCCLQVSALDFDLSVFDLFAMPACGGTIVMLSEDTAKDPAVWKKCISDHHVTVWNSVPALFEMLMLSVEQEETIASLRNVLLSGDYVMPELFAKLRQRNPACRMTALGGATEAAIWSNYYEVNGTEDPNTHIPYGKPLSNQQFRVVKDGRDAADGETGELWIGGAGLAKGYIGDAEKTAAAFVQDADGKRWYRTGDLGHYRADGNLIFEGRMDHQIKLHGFRIELGEIESRLNALHGISRCTALVDQNAENKRLGVVIVPESGRRAWQPTVQADPVPQEDPCAPVVFAWMRHIMERLPIEQVTSAMQPVIRLWQEKLRDFESGTPTNPQLREFAAELERREELLLKILRGACEPTVLLDDPFLSPQRLMEQLPLNADLEALADAVAENGRAATVAVIGGRDGAIIFRLLEKIADRCKIGKVLYFESGTALLQAAEQTLRPLGLPVAYLRTDYRHLRAEYAGVADAVISINGIHLFENIPDGLDWIRLLLHEGSCVHMLESASLPSVGYVSAAVLEYGFEGYTDLRKGRGNPMLTPEEWHSVLTACGFCGIHAVPCGCGGLYRYAFGADKSLCVRNQQELTEICGEHLVYYMVPDVFCYCTGFPLSSNGKVDHQQMRSWIAETAPRTGTPPQTDHQRTLAAIWRELLGTEEIFAEDHFFEIGGDSLIATRLLASVRARFSVTCSMKELFDHPRLCEMAEMIGAACAEEQFEEGEL